MKSRQQLYQLLLCTTLLLLGTTVVQGAETDGTVTFRPSKDLVGETIKPEQQPEEVIYPLSGSATAGLLRLQHVPDFNFKEWELEVGKQVFTPTLEQYQSKDPQKNDIYSIPHFIQVTDIRGTNEGWKIKVSATVFENEDGHQLKNTRLTFTEAKLSNDVFSTTISDKVNIFSGESSLEIPTEPKNGEILMETKGNDIETTTNGTRTSLVLNNDYLPSTSYDLLGKNSGVRLTKSALDSPFVQTDYRATIKWDLISGL